MSLDHYWNYAGDELEIFPERLQGLIYDLERRAIVSLLPRPDVLSVLALGLEGTAQLGVEG
jgi:hypothetical protein